MPIRAEVGGRVDVGTLAADFEGAIHIAAERIPFSGRYDHETAAGTLALHRRFAVEDPFRLGGSLPVGEIEVAGTLAVDVTAGRTSPNSPYSVEVQGRVSDGHVRLGTLGAHGVSIGAAVRKTGADPATGEATFAADTVDTGVSFGSLSGSLSLLPTAPPGIHLASLSGQVFGGTFSVEDVAFDPETGADIELRLDGLDVTELLAVQGTSLTGTGIVDGVVPVAMRDGGITIGGGRVVSRQPGGRIRLPADPAAGVPDENARFDTMMQALDDFRYDSLDVAVDYDTDGTLRLGVRIQGRSPNVEQGRLIDLNANVSQNLRSLLRSLQVTSNLEARVRQHAGGRR